MGNKRRPVVHAWAPNSIDVLCGQGRAVRATSLNGHVTCGRCLRCSERRPIPVIEEWYVQFTDDKFGQPWTERRRRVCGELHGHMSRPDGTRIETSYVVKMANLVATTVSGSTYRLGTPDETMRRYMEGTYPGWDWRNPIQEPGVAT